VSPERSELTGFELIQELPIRTSVRATAKAREYFRAVGVVFKANTFIAKASAFGSGKVVWSDQNPAKESFGNRL